MKINVKYIQDERKYRSSVVLSCILLFLAIFTTYVALKNSINHSDPVTCNHMERKGDFVRCITIMPVEE